MANQFLPFIDFCATCCRHFHAVEEGEECTWCEVGLPPSAFTKPETAAPAKPVEVKDPLRHWTYEAALKEMAKPRNQTMGSFGW